MVELLTIVLEQMIVRFGISNLNMCINEKCTQQKKDWVYMMLYTNIP
jgi:hypothetical protein